MHQCLPVMYQCQRCLLGDVTRDTRPQQYTLTLSALTCLASTAIRTCQYCIRHVTYYDAKLFECWPAVSDVGRALKQHWVNVSCLLGSAPVINSRLITASLTKCLGQRRRRCASIETMLAACDCPAVACLPVWSVCPRGIHNNTADTRRR